MEVSLWIHVPCNDAYRLAFADYGKGPYPHLIGLAIPQTGNELNRRRIILQTLQMVSGGTDKPHNLLVVILEICNRAKTQNWTEISGVPVAAWNHSLAFLSKGTYL